MTAEVEYVLVELAKRYDKNEDMQKVTHEDLGMDLDEFNKALKELIQVGYLPGGTKVVNPTGRDIYFSGKELSEEAKKKVKEIEKSLLEEQ